MDSLHVAPQQQTGSKTSSRSTSPCRPHLQQHQQQHHNHPRTHYQPHHTKSLSHGSVEITKIQETAPAKPPRHRSPTTTTTTATKDMDKSGQQHDETMGGDLTGEVDEDVCYGGGSSFMSNGSSEHEVQYVDELDSSSRTNPAIEHLINKIKRTKDCIRLEQTLRDDNVKEYLHLASNAEKHQLQRIKTVFEKKNQKSAHVISQLQKKLDIYQKKLREYETHGPAQSHRPPRVVLKDVGQGLKNVGGNIRDGITGFSGSVMSKPREFAHLIKNKFGSADNINQLSTWYIGPGTTGSDSGATNGGGGTGSGTGTGGSDTGVPEKPNRVSSTLPANLHGAVPPPQPKFPSEEASECSSVTSESLDRYHGRAQDGASKTGTPFNYQTLFAQMQAMQEEMERLREKSEKNQSLQQEIQFLNSSLQEERFKTDRLEEQINDLTELHQNEVENLKQAMADMEEKVQYQSEERLRDVHEMLEHCQTKIQKMEHQAAQQQQYVSLEGLDNSNARALVVKLINVLLTVLQVILLLVATGAGIIMPFLRTRVRILTTVSIVLAAIFVLKQWPEVQDIGNHAMRRLKSILDPVK